MEDRWNLSELSIYVIENVSERLPTPSPLQPGLTYDMVGKGPNRGHDGGHDGGHG